MESNAAPPQLMLSGVDDSEPISNADAVASSSPPRSVRRNRSSSSVNTSPGSSAMSRLRPKQAPAVPVAAAGCAILDALDRATVHREYNLTFTPTGEKESWWMVQLDDDVRGGMTLGIYAWATFHAHVPWPPVPPIPPMVLQMLNTAAVKNSVTLDFEASASVDEPEPTWWRSVRIERAVKLATFEAMPLRLRRLEWTVTKNATQGGDDDAEAPSDANGRATIPRSLLSSPACRTLRHLTLYRPTAVRLLEASAALPSLQSLELVDGRGVNEPYLDARALFSGSPAIAGLVQRLRKLRLYHAHVDVSHLAECCGATLEELYLSASTVTAAASLTRFVALRVLHLRESPNDDDWLRLFTSISSSLMTLEEIDVNSRFFSWASAGIGLMPRLRRLRVHGRACNADYCLSSSTSLTSLDVRRWNCPDGTVLGLDRIPTLTSLRCGHFVEGLNLASCARLVNLDLSQSGVTAEGLAGVERIATLRQLRLWKCCALTAVNCLASSTSIERLDLTGSGVTSEGLVGLERIPTLRVLWLCDCEGVTAVDCLSRSPSLRTLELKGSGVREAAQAAVALQHTPPIRLRINIDAFICFYGPGGCSRVEDQYTEADVDADDIIPRPITAYTVPPLDLYLNPPPLRHCSPL